MSFGKEEGKTADGTLSGQSDDGTPSRNPYAEERSGCLNQKDCGNARCSTGVAEDQGQLGARPQAQNRSSFRGPRKMSLSPAKLPDFNF